MFKERDRVKVHYLAKKKELGQYPAILSEQALSIKDFFCGFLGNFSCGKQRVIPSFLGAISPARVANHSAGFGLSCRSQSMPNNKGYYQRESLKVSQQSQ